MLLTLIGGFARFYNLGGPSIWLDDAYLYWFADGTWADLWNRSTQFHSAPPLFVVFIKGVKAINDSEAGLRFLPALIGTLCIPAFHLLARRILAVEAAVTATAFVTIAERMVYLSREVREYSAVFLLSCAMILLYLRYLDRPTLKRSLALGGVAAVGLWIHYSLGIVVIVLNAAYVVHMLRTSNCRRRLLVWAAGQSIVAAAGLAVLALVFRTQFFVGRGQEYLQDGYWSGTASDLLRLCLLQPILITSNAGGMLGIALAIAGLLWWLHSGLGRRVVPIAACGVVIALTLAILQIYPLFAGRQISYGLPLVFLLVGSAVQFGRTRHQRRLAAITMVTLSCSGGAARDLAARIQSPGPEELRPVIAYLDKHQGPGDRIFVTPGARLAFEYYTRNQNWTWIAGTPNDGYFEGKTLRLTLQNEMRYVEDLRRELGRPGRLWLVASHLHPVEPSLSEVLDYIGRSGRVQPVIKQQGAELFLAQ
jgi:mannosyltransferase